MTNVEKEIIEGSKEFAKLYNLHYDEMTESMILNAIRYVTFHNNLMNQLDKHEKINQYIQQGKDIPEELTKNFVTFPNKFNSKVYVVECSSGSWDSYHWWIGGITLDEQEAHKMCDALNAEAERIKSECPYQGDPYGDDITAEEETAYWSYKMKYENEMEWSPAVVKEYPFNQLIPTKNFGG